MSEKISQHEIDYYEKMEKEFNAEQALILESKLKFNEIGLDYLSIDTATDSLDRLLKENKEVTESILHKAQWHYMEIINIISGLLSKEQLKIEQEEYGDLIKEEKGKPVFEEIECVKFMSQRYSIPIEICSAYVLSRRWV
ncbi:MULTISPECIES: hypothetical protein [unclassified Providencia]|uniref:hypothetical protein n=1 Tax=unclassified Providencia TaxID=2633465 RepID=UPI00234A9D52|nr:MULTISPECIES: hypothetical protein [unclassified Providencia]